MEGGDTEPAALGDGQGSSVHNELSRAWSPPNRAASSQDRTVTRLTCLAQGKKSK